MAKRKRTHRKHSRPMSELSKRRKSPVRRRKHSRRKGMLSELMNPATATQSAKAVFSGAVGGFAAGYLDEPTQTMQPIVRGAVFLGASFLASSILKMPNVGSGIAGAYGLLLNRKMQGLADDFEQTDYAEETLNASPEFLDENGKEMFLADDGEFYYLEEFETDEDENQMSANYLAEYMPGYAPKYN